MFGRGAHATWPTWLPLTQTDVITLAVLMGKPCRSRPREAEGAAATDARSAQPDPPAGAVCGEQGITAALGGGRGPFGGLPGDR